MAFCRISPWGANCHAHRRPSPVSLRLPQIARVIPGVGPFPLASQRGSSLSRDVVVPGSQLILIAGRAPRPLFLFSLILYKTSLERCGLGVKWLTSIPFIQMLCCRVIAGKSFHVFSSCRFGVGTGRDGYSDIGDPGDISLFMYKFFIKILEW